MPKNKKHANPELGKAMREIAKSGAWGTHQDKRQRRARTRHSSLTRSIKEDQS